MITVIDEGNTLTKIYFIENHNISFGAIFSKNEKAIDFLKKQKVTKIIYISVVEKSDLYEYVIKNFSVFRITTELSSEVENKYLSPKTLGLDRWCAVNGAWFLKKQKPFIVIDFGTAITIDFVNDKLQYLGGSIAPGIEIKLKSLNYFTSKLPLVNFSNNVPEIIGRDTESSILSGVVNGTLAEINCIINDYKKLFGNIFIFFTGGNSYFFELHTKNANFVSPYLVPLGGYAIYLYNSNSNT